MRRQIEKRRAIGADKARDLRFGNVEIQECLNESSVPVDRAHRAKQPKIGREHRTLDADEVNQTEQILGIAFLRAAGVAEIFGPGTNVLSAAFAVLAQIEGRLSNR